MKRLALVGILLTGIAIILVTGDSINMTAEKKQQYTEVQQHFERLDREVASLLEQTLRLRAQNGLEITNLIAQVQLAYAKSYTNGMCRIHWASTYNGETGVGEYLATEAATAWVKKENKDWEGQIVHWLEPK